MKTERIAQDTNNLKQQKTNHVITIYHKNDPTPRLQK